MVQFQPLQFIVDALILILIILSRAKDSVIPCGKVGICRKSKILLNNLVFETCYYWYVTKLLVKILFCKHNRKEQNMFSMFFEISQWYTFFIIFDLLKTSTMTSPTTRKGRFRVSSSDAARWSSNFLTRGQLVISEQWQCCRRFWCSADVSRGSVVQRTTYIGTKNTFKGLV